MAQCHLIIIETNANSKATVWNSNPSLRRRRCIETIASFGEIACVCVCDSTLFVLIWLRACCECIAVICFRFEPYWKIDGMLLFLSFAQTFFPPKKCGCAILLISGAVRSKTNRQQERNILTYNGIRPLRSKVMRALSPPPPYPKWNNIQQSKCAEEKQWENMKRSSVCP